MHLGSPSWSRILEQEQIVDFELSKCHLGLDAACGLTLSVDFHKCLTEINIGAFGISVFWPVLSTSPYAGKAGPKCEHSFLSNSKPRFGWQFQLIPADQCDDRPYRRFTLYLDQSKACGLHSGQYKEKHVWFVIGYIDKQVDQLDIGLLLPPSTSRFRHRVHDLGDTCGVEVNDLAVVAIYREMRQRGSAWETVDCEAGDVFLQGNCCRVILYGWVRAVEERVRNVFSW